MPELVEKALKQETLIKKEIFYIHTEAFASRELKHGTIDLIEQRVHVIAIVTQEEQKW